MFDSIVKLTPKNMIIQTKNKEMINKNYITLRDSKKI